MPEYTVTVIRTVTETTRYRIHVPDELMEAYGYEADAAALAVLDGAGGPGDIERLGPPTYQPTGELGVAISNTC